MKWADYCISKISFNEAGKSIAEAFVHIDYVTTVGPGETRDRNWLVQKSTSGSTFCIITRSIDGEWLRFSDFKYNNASFQWTGSIPELITRRKTFISYYHADDQYHKERFENLFSDLVVSKSVDVGDIHSDNSDEYIKQLIQKDYLSDTTVLVVLIGPKTKCRKHVDWEIAGALSQKVGNSYAGLMGLLLPSHPDYGESTYKAENLPNRLAANLNSGYASLYDWEDDRVKMQKRIEATYAKRYDAAKIINRSISQLNKNLCD